MVGRRGSSGSRSRGPSVSVAPIPAVRLRRARAPRRACRAQRRLADVGGRGVFRGARRIGAFRAAASRAPLRAPALAAARGLVRAEFELARWAAPRAGRHGLHRRARERRGGGSRTECEDAWRDVSGQGRNRESNDGGTYARDAREVHRGRSARGLLVRSNDRILQPACLDTPARRGHVPPCGVIWRALYQPPPDRGAGATRAPRRQTRLSRTVYRGQSAWAESAFGARQSALESEGSLHG